MGILMDVVEALGNVEVRGEANLNRLLWSIQTLRKLEYSQAEAQKKPPKEEKPKEGKADG